MWLFDDRTGPGTSRPTLPGPQAQELLERDQRYMSPSYTRVYPLVVDRGSGAVIEDVDGNLFLDFTAGIAVTATGHCHPHVVAAIQDQAAKLLHMSRHRLLLPAADRPGPAAGRSRRPGTSPKRVFFTNSGAEALEAALKLARWHTGRSRAIAFFGAFHGRTYGAMSLSGSKLVHRRGFSPLVPDIHHVPYPARLHGRAPTRRLRLRPADRGDGAASGPPRRTRWPPSSSSRSRARAATTCRRRASCRRCASCATGTASCWSPTRCRRGMGRTGKMFAVEHWGVEPDIICLAKGIASGMPLGAIIATRRGHGLAAAAATPARSAATRSAAGPPWRRSTCSKAATWPTPPSAASSCEQGLRQLQQRAPDASATCAAWG